MMPPPPSNAIWTSGTSTTRPRAPLRSSRLWADDATLCRPADERPRPRRHRRDDRRGARALSGAPLRARTAPSTCTATTCAFPGGCSTLRASSSRRAPTSRCSTPSSASAPSPASSTRCRRRDAEHAHERRRRACRWPWRHLIGMAAIGSGLGVGVMGAKFLEASGAPARADERAAGQGVPADGADRQRLHHQHRHRAVVHHGEPVQGLICGRGDAARPPGPIRAHRAGRAARLRGLLRLPPPRVSTAAKAGKVRCSLPAPC